MSRKKHYKHDRKKEIKLEKFALLGLAAVTIGLAGASLAQAEETVAETPKTLVDTPESTEKELAVENSAYSNGETGNQVVDKEKKTVEGEKPALQTVTFDVVEVYHFFVAGGRGDAELSRKTITLKPGESYTLKANTYKDFELDDYKEGYDYKENLKNIGRTITNDGSDQIKEEYIITFQEIIREVPDPTDSTSSDIYASKISRDTIVRVFHLIDWDEQNWKGQWGLTRTYSLPLGKRFDPKDLANPAYGTLLKYEVSDTAVGVVSASVYYKSHPKETLVSPTTNVSVSLIGADVAAVDKIVADKVLDTTILAKLPAELSSNNVELYDVKTQKEDGSFVQISGEATVTIPVDPNRKVAKVIYFLPETGAVEELPFELSADGKYVHFKVSHFSNYGVVYQSQDTEKPNPQPNPALQPDPAPQPNPVPQPDPAPQPNPAPQPDSTPQPNSTPQPDSTPQPNPTLQLDPAPQPNPALQPDLTPELNLQPQDNGKDKDSRNLSEEPKKIEDVKSDPSKKEIEKTEDKEKALPKTGENSSLLGSVGAVLLGMMTLLKFSFKKKRN